VPYEWIEKTELNAALLKLILEYWSEKGVVDYWHNEGVVEHGDILCFEQD